MIMDGYKVSGRGIYFKIVHSQDKDTENKIYNPEFCTTFSFWVSGGPK